MDYLKKKTYFYVTQLFLQKFLRNLRGKKMMELITGFSNVAGYSINIKDKNKLCVYIPAN